MFHDLSPLVLCIHCLGRSEIPQRVAGIPPSRDIDAPSLKLFFRERHRRDNDRALDDELQRRTDAEQDQAVVQRTDNQAS